MRQCYFWRLKIAKVQQRDNKKFTCGLELPNYKKGNSSQHKSDGVLLKNTLVIMIATCNGSDSVFHIVWRAGDEPWTICATRVRRVWCGAVGVAARRPSRA